MSVPHHYPSELLELLVDTIPRLVRRRDAVLDFFLAAGVDKRTLADLRMRLAVKDELGKFEITRTVLVRLNEAGDAALRARREVVKRVTEWEDFSTCWDNEVLKARGLVAEVRRVVNVKDTFARLAQERDREASERRKDREERIAALQARTLAIQSLKTRFAATFGIEDAARRGKALEPVLNEFFALGGLSVREAFHVVGVSGEGIVEQIDGAVEVDGRLYLVEMKWRAKPVGMPELASFMSKVFFRGGCGGIFIAHPGVTGAGVSTLRDANTRGATAFGCTLQSMFNLLDRDADIKAFLKSRIEAATLDRNPYVEGAIAESE